MTAAEVAANRRENMSAPLGKFTHLRAAHFLAAPVELADRLSTDLAFLGCESNDVLFLRHGNSLGSRRIPR